MGSSSSILVSKNNQRRRSSYGLWTVEEKYEIDRGIQKQRKGAEFAASFMFYGVPISSSKASVDPLSPMFITVDIELLKGEATNAEKPVDEKILHSVPSSVSIRSNGTLSVIFNHSNVQYEIDVDDISRAMDSTDAIIPLPIPPYLDHATSNTIFLYWNLPFPGGIVQRVEVQYASSKNSTKNGEGAGPESWLALTSKMWESPSLCAHKFENLLPGSTYIFRLRYWIPLGWSAWSTPSPNYSTLPDIPQTPDPPLCAILLPDAAQLCWTRPKCNGSPVTSFILRGRGIGEVLNNDNINEIYVELYRGPLLTYLALRLHPESAYSFEVAAINEVGQSPFSVPLSLHTPPRTSPTSGPNSSTGGGNLPALRCPQAWSECWDPLTGTAFYFNVITGTRQVERPEALGGVAIRPTTNLLKEKNEDDTDTDQGGSNSNSNSSNPKEMVDSMFRKKRFRILRTLLNGTESNTNSNSGSTTPTRTILGSSNSSPGTSSIAATTTAFTLSIRREELFQDACQQLMTATVTQLRGGSNNGRHLRTKIQFVDEPGIDAGGPAREFFLLFSQQAMQYALRQGLLRTCSKEGTLFFAKSSKTTNSSSSHQNSSSSNNKKKRKGKEGNIILPSEYFSILGKFFALAILDRQLVSFPMAEAWLQQMVTGEGTALLSQLSEIEGELQASLLWMLRPDTDITGVIDETFSVEVDNDNNDNDNNDNDNDNDNDKRQDHQERKQKEASDKVSMTVPTTTSPAFPIIINHNNNNNNNKKKKRISLCRDGETKEVTQENKEEYVRLLLQWRTSYAFSSLLQPFLQNFHALIPVDLLRTSGLTAMELGQMLGGKVDIDVDSLRPYTIYQSSSSPSSTSTPSSSSTNTTTGPPPVPTTTTTTPFDGLHPLCLWYWQALRSMSQEDLKSVLRFITGSERVPLDGYDPPLNITLGEDMIHDSLPKAHTCFNQIVLPVYSSYERLYDRLLFAVNNTAGFELT